MTRRISLLFLGLLCFVASAQVGAASHPSITGYISGIELCPQEVCQDGAFFSGTVVGQVNNKLTSGAWWVQVKHASPLNTALNGTTAVTGGSWMIRTQAHTFFGTVQNGGALTYLGENRFAVNITLEVQQGGNGTILFSGVLDHNPFPPTIIGTLAQ